MTTHATSRGRQGLSAAVLIVGGAAVAAAVWAGGSPGWAIAAMGAYLVFAAIAYMWAGGSGDMAAVLRGAADERQRSVEREALAITAQVMTVVALVGAIIQISRNGNPGVFGFFCAAQAIVYGASWAILRTRR